MENEIVQLLKAVTPAIWSSLVKQQFIYGYILSFFTALSIGTLLVTAILHKWQETAHNKVGEYTDLLFYLVVTSAILLALFIITGLPRFLNPEYYAVMSILP